MAMGGMPGGMPGAMPGAMPPGIAGGTGAAAMPQPMKPQGIDGVAGVKAAVELLQKSLGSLQPGTDVQAAVLKSVMDLSKHLGNSGQDVSPQDQIQQMVAASRALQQGGGNPLASMMSPGGPGGAPPPPPPPAGDA